MDMIPEPGVSQFRSLLTPKPEVLAWSVNPTKMDPLLARFVHHPLTSLDGMCLDLTDFEPHRSHRLLAEQEKAFAFDEIDVGAEHSDDRGDESDSFDREDLALQIENHTRELCGLPPLTLLLKKGIRDATVPICTQCLKCLRTNRTPKDALARFNVIGDVPPELQDLTLAEKMIIARGRVRMSILKLTPIQPHKQKALRGNVISFHKTPRVSSPSLNSARGWSRSFLLSNWRPGSLLFFVDQTNLHQKLLFK
jgi:hypothetical protein